MARITPFLWFDDDAEEAVDFYTSIFKNSEILSVSRVGEGAPGPGGAVLTINFILEGQEFIALNGGPQFQFTEAISLFVNCEGQGEIDELWEVLTDGGEESRCGWLKDRYGLSWQIVPSALSGMLQDEDPGKSEAVMEALLQMDKIDLNVLQQAYARK